MSKPNLWAPATGGKATYYKLSNELHDALSAQAEKEDRTMNDVTRRILAWYLGTGKPSPNPPKKS